MNSGISDSEFKGDKLMLDDLKKLLPKFEVIPQDYPGNYIVVWGF